MKDGCSTVSVRGREVTRPRFNLPLADIYFGVGLFLILAESFFYNYIAALAHSPFWVRSVIGYNLFPSEIWFIFGGVVFVCLLLISANYKISKYSISDIKPIFLIISVYSLSFLYGFGLGNDGALQAFREMVFGSLCLPAILLLAPYLRKKVVVKFFYVGCMVTVIWVFIAVRERFILETVGVRLVHNAFLLIMPFFVSFYLMYALIMQRLYFVLAIVMIIPFLVAFSKLSVVTLIFSVFACVALSGLFDKENRNFILSIFRARKIVYAIAFITIAIVGLYFISVLSGGIIENRIRTTFFKERINFHGEIFYGDVTGGRFAFWKASVAEFLNKPVSGYGLGAVIKAYSHGEKEMWHIHNYFFQSLHNTGLIGILLILGGWYFWCNKILRKLLAIHDCHNKILLASMLVFVANLMFYGLYAQALSYPPVSIFFWLCIGVLSASKKSNSSNINQIFIQT